MSLRRFFTRRTRARDHEDEVRSHLQLAIQHYIDRGMTPDEARRHARLRFGNPRAHREGVDDMNRLPIFDTLGRDLRYAVRRMRQAPGFSATVILTLAVTIGAASTVFSLADAILLRPLSLPEPDRLVLVSYKRTTPTGEYIGPALDGAMWTAVRDHTRLIDAVVWSDGTQAANFVLGQTPSIVSTQLVGAGYFRVLGVPPARGREFLPEEAMPGGPAVAILSHGFWQRVFAGQDALGSTILLRGEPFTIVGVMPSGFTGLAEADVWTPLRGAGQGLNYSVVARLRPGTTHEAADAELASLGDAPFTMEGSSGEGVIRSLVVQDLHGARVGTARGPIEMLGWGVGAVLLIACVNITALLLARGGSRTKEIATRMALGGGRTAVVRQLMIESLVLAMAGGMLGIGVALAGIEGLKTAGGMTFSEWNQAGLDYRSVGATFVLATLTAIVFGLLPAWQTSRIDVQVALGEGGSRSIAGGSRHLLHRLLVVTQVALGVIVLVAAGLLLRQFLVLKNLDPGFTPTSLYTVSVSLQDARYRDGAIVNHLFTSSLEKLAQTPGIQAAAISQRLPYERLLNMVFRIEGHPQGGTPSIANLGYVTTGFFDTFGIRLLDGRVLDERDRTGTPLVAVVNDAFRRLYFPQEPILGRRLLFGTTAIEIVGVSHDVQQGGAGFFRTGMQRGPVATSPTIYIPAAQTDSGMFGWFSPAWTVRAASGAEAAAALSRAIGETDALLPIGPVRSMDEIMARATARPRLMMTLVGALALAALLLAAIGIHGLITHVVSERTREFGIRLALGATPRQTITAIASSGILLAVIGAAAGVGLSIPSVTLIQAFLYTVQPGDITTYIGVGALLLVVACLSSIAPALRILRLDPARTLRE